MTHQSRSGHKGRLYSLDVRCSVACWSGSPVHAGKDVSAMPKDRQDNHFGEDRTVRSVVSSVAAPPQTTTRRVTLLRGVALPYTLRVSTRARVVRLVIRPETGLEVVAPRGTP